MTDQSASNEVELLDHTLLFSNLHPQHKAQVFSTLVRKDYAAGQVIFNEGDPGDALYLIRSGKVSIYTTNKNLGVTFELATLSRGQVFGEMALLTEEKRSASVKTIEPTSCYILSLAVFNKIVQQLPAVSLGMAQTMAKRLAEVNKQKSIAFGSLSDYDFDMEVYSMVPAQVLERHKIIPLVLEGTTLVVAMVDPKNTMGLDDVRRILRDVDLRPLAISGDDYERFLRDKVKKAQAAGGGLGKARGVDHRQVKIFSATSESADQGTEARGSEVVELVSQLMAEGVEKGASDIHIDHESHGVIVRFRVDGVLHTREKLIPLSFSKPLVARIKVIANMDPTERMHPQDGRISITYREHDYDFRVATIPVKRGERVTLRLLDSGGSLIDINKLVLAPALAKIIQAMIHKPQGIVLVTGPTGSGKTTTLYSLIKERLQAQNAINIVTAEDPVEYTLPGVAQVEVNEHRGLTFPMVLRSFLRHDPDVILIGETRDPETARISVQAALTGHLVVTSLHTNSALDSLVRLKDLGIEDYLLGSAITGIIAQRLVRHICPVCAAPAELSQAVKDALTRVGVLKNGEEMVAKKGSGCDQCGGTGYKGRVGIYEVFSPTDSTRALISHGASQDEIKADAQRNGMVMLNQYAALLLKNGITTASEVLRVLDS